MERTKSWWLHSINAVLQYDFTHLRNSGLLSAWCIYLLIFKKYAIKSVCVRVSTLILLTKTKSYENVDISASEIPYSVWKWKTRLEEVVGIQGIVCACNKKASSIDFYFFCLLLETALLCHDLVSNFSYSVKSSSATYAHLFNTEKNRSSIEKLRLWFT